MQSVPKFNGVCSEQRSYGPSGSSAIYEPHEIGSINQEFDNLGVWDPGVVDQSGIGIEDREHMQL